MPLSEDEQRILSEIEEQLYESDPDLVREVGSTTVYTHAFRGLKWAAALFVVGLVLMMGLLFYTNHVLAFLGFLVMLASALWFERNARRLGRVGWEQMTQSAGSAGMRDFFGSQGQRVRERFKRDDDVA